MLRDSLFDIDRPYATYSINMNAQLYTILPVSAQERLNLQKGVKQIPSFLSIFEETH